MIFIKNISSLFVALAVIACSEVSGQVEDNLSTSLLSTNYQLDFYSENNQKRILPELAVRRSGPYIGLQSGKYLVSEFGYEMQWNKVKLRKPITHAGHMGFNYNFQRNVLGYDAGYWLKIGRLDLTYGANVVFRTDFDREAFGVAPVVGFKFWQLHLQTGYHALTRSAKDMETNTFFVSLRFVFINNSDWDWKRKNKKD